MNRLAGIGKWTIVAIAGGALALLLILSITSSAHLNDDELPVFVADNVFINIAAFAATLAAAYIIVKRDFVPGKRLLIICTALYCALILAYLVLLRGSPFADGKMIIRGLELLLKGDYSYWETGGYFNFYPHQNGLALFFSGFVVIFGRYAKYALQVANIGFLLLAHASISRLAGELFDDDKIANRVYLALLLLAPAAFYCAFIYGNIPGLALSCAGMLLIVRGVKRKCRARGVGGAALMALGAVLKQNYLIVIVACTIALAFFAIYHKNIRLMIYGALSFAIFFALNWVISFAASNITGIPPKQGMPRETWVAMGMQDIDSGCGRFNAFSERTFFETGFSAEITREISVESIKQSISYMKANPRAALAFYMRKISTQWNDGTFESLWVNYYSIKASRRSHTQLSSDSRAYRAVSAIYDAFLTPMYAGALAFLLLTARRVSAQSLILYIAFIGAFLFSVIWEAKAQYIMPFAYMLVPCAAQGHMMLAKRLFGRKWQVSEVRI